MIRIVSRSVLTLFCCAALACGPLEGSVGDTGSRADTGTAAMDSGTGGFDTGPADTGGGIGPRPDFAELVGLDTTQDPGCTATWMAAVTGRIVGEDGTPIENARPQLCLTKQDGSFLCTIPPASGADGWYVQVIGEENRCVVKTALRALLPGATAATTYCHLDPTPEDGIYNQTSAIVIYDIDAASVPAEGDALAPRDVTVADGLVLGGIIPSELEGDYDRMGGRRITTTPCFAEGLGLDGLYGLAPEGKPSDAGYSVRIPAPGLADGTRVELLVLGGLNTVLISGEEVEEADMVVFGQGTVMGGMIVGDESARLPELTWLGYRAM